MVDMADELLTKYEDYDWKIVIGNNLYYIIKK